MSVGSQRRNPNSNKDSSTNAEDPLSKKNEQNNDERVRILQDNLVFVSALPNDIATRETLLSPFYFARYGSVTKLILNVPAANKKTALCQAYVTYTTALEAALAIVALDGYKLSDRPLKVSYGTTKYCSHFLRGHDCPNPDCFYLHQIDRTREVSSGDTRTIFKEQNSKAMNRVLQNLDQMADRALDEDEQEEGFPSVSELLDYLIDNDFVSAAEVERATERAKIKNRPVIELPKLEARVQSMIDPKQREKQNHKLVKSSSHSTMCTPTKGTDEVIVKKKEQQKEQKEKQIVIRQTVGKQNALGGRQLKLQEKIEKLIIKQILKKGNNQCRSRFVKGAVASREECSRLRGIVQKFLIAHN